MSDKKKQPTERTRTGHEVPVPKRREFFSNLRKVAKVGKRSTPASGPEKK